MAVADAKLTGRPGIAAVSRGPGASNAAIAVHLAQQDAVPLILLVGQVARHERGRGAFQEVDYGQMFGGIAKGVWEIHHAEYLPETVARAFHLAQAGTPGPVVLSLPEDMLSEPCAAPVLPRHEPARPGPSETAIDSAAELLAEAERPLIIAGSGTSRPQGRAALARLAQVHRIPVALTFKHQQNFDNGSDLYAGHLGFKIPVEHVDLLARADLILAIGTRLGDVPTQGYRLPQAPQPRQSLIHVWPDANAIGGIFRTDLPLPCDPAAFCEALAARPPQIPAARADWVAGTHAMARRMADYRVRQTADGLDFGAVVAELVAQAPRETIVTTDAGNFSTRVHRMWPWDGSQPALGAAGGAMGLAVPGAVAACLRHPDRPVIAFLGDGGALMTGNELAIAIAQGARPKLVISDNGTYGTIRLHQERDHPHRVSGTDPVNRDFTAWAAAFGAGAVRLGPGDDVAAGVARFLAHDGPAVLHVRSSAQAISAFTTIEALHARERRPPAG